MTMLLWGVCYGLGLGAGLALLSTTADHECVRGWGKASRLRSRDSAPLFRA